MKRIIAAVLVGLVLPFTFSTAPADAATTTYTVCSRPIGTNPPVCRTVVVHGPNWHAHKHKHHKH